MKVLAAVGDPAFVGELQGKERGLEVSAATSMEEATGLLQEHEPAFVVVDERLPFAHELTIAIKSEVDGPDRDRIPVVALEQPGGGGAGVRCLPDLRFGAATPAGDVVQAAKALVMRRARQRRLFDQELVLDVRTEPEAVELTGDVFDRLMQIAGYAEEEQVRLGHTFREALGNAAEHGNKNDPARRIVVNYLRSADRITVVITDEGPGFDTAAFLARAEQVSALEHTRSRRANEVRPGGLGVFIMKQTCDRIGFNGAGNAIYLMKYLPGHAPPSGVG
ncbi:MAG: ATP-binding protein [Planctomycetes bacterium]|nr:ATP-binding protein [Planctomycetota bacterium]